MPFFSVVIPLFNKEIFIENTLNSVLNQTFNDFELIVINDGSTDNSLEIVKNHLLNFKNGKIIDQKNKGLSASRNRGIIEAKGELIAFLDADDLWQRNFLKKVYNLHQNFPKASIYGSSYLEKYNDKSSIELKKNIDLSNNKKEILIEDFFDANLFQPIICQSSFAAKKSVFHEVKYDENINFSEDIDWYIRAFSKHNLAYCNSELAIVSMNIPGQLTSLGIDKKTIPNFSVYENEAESNKSLKKYLDFYRYMFSIQYKLCGNISKSNELIEKIDFKNLTGKQKLLIKSPIVFLRILKRIKKYLLKYNVRLTSF